MEFLKFTNFLAMLLAFLSFGLTPWNAQAEPLEFRSDGFFASPDGEVKLRWDSSAKVGRLSVHGKDLVTLVGPTNGGGTITAWSGSAYKTHLDPATHTVSVHGELPSQTPCRLSMAESQGGVLWEIATQGPEDEAPVTRVLFPTASFSGKKVFWGDRVLELPKEYSKDSSVFFAGANGKLPTLRVELEKGLYLSITPSQGGKETTLSDCRRWNEANYHLVVKASKGGSSLLLKVERERDAEPKNNAASAGKSDSKNLLNEGASFECGPDGVQVVSSFSWTEKMTTAGILPSFDPSTSVHGQTSLKLVAESPESHHGRFTFSGAIFKRTLLERRTDYTLSAWVKADRPSMKVNLFCSEETFDASDGKPFEVSTEWKRCSFTFNSGDFKKTGWFFTWIRISPTCHNGVVWVDAVQLEKGALSDFKPSSELEYGVEISSSDKLFEKGQNAELIVRGRNNSQNPLDETMSYVVNDFWGNPVRQGTQKYHLDPNGGFQAKIDLGILPCGYYKTLVKFPGEEEEAVFGVYQPHPLTTLANDWPMACHNDPSPLVRKLGFGMVRGFEIFQFANVAPEPDRFDFSKTDRFVQECERSGLTTMPVLGVFEWPSYRKLPPIPPYAQEKVDERLWGGQRKYRIAWPKIDAWKRYVHALVERYKGRITYWEVLNEPNLCMSAQEYLPYLKAAYEAAKEADPTCRIVGICATSDFNGKADNFARHCLQLGAAKYCDVISVHMYGKNPPETTFGIGSDKCVVGWRKLVKDNDGKDTDVWHTEKGYISAEGAYSAKKAFAPLEYLQEPQFLISSQTDKANWMVRETLLSAVAGGKGKFFWYAGFDDQTFITHRIFMPYTLDLTEYDNAPQPALLAANGLALALDGMYSPEYQLWDGTTRGALFSGPQGTMAAIWRTHGKSKATIQPGNINLRCLNLFGESVELPLQPDGSVEIVLSESPKYLRFEGTGLKNSVEQLKTMRLLDPDPIKHRESMLMLDGHPAWKLRFVNPGFTTMDVTIAITCPSGWRTSVSEKSFNAIKPGAEVEAVFSLQQTPESSAGDPFVFQVHADGKRHDIQAKSPPFASSQELEKTLSFQTTAIAKRMTPGTITIDGNLDDWPEDHRLFMATEKFVDGSSGDAWLGFYDSSISLRLRWDNTFLYVAARVFDNVIVSPEKPETAYERDCLELFLSPDGHNLFQGFIFPYNENFSGPKAWWSVRESKAGGQVQKKFEMGTQVAIKRLADGYILEAAIPWSGLGKVPQIGDRFPFTFHLNDSDASQASHKTSLIWQGDGTNYRSSNRWGSMLFE